MRDHQIEIILEQLLAFLIRLQTFKFFLKYLPLEHKDATVNSSISGAIQMVELCIASFSTTQGFMEQEDSDSSKLMMQWCVNSLVDQEHKIDYLDPQARAVSILLKKLTTEARSILNQMKKRDKK